MTDHQKPHIRDDSLSNAVGGAVADIRQKLVEEAWFGRAISGQNAPTYYEMVRAMYGEPKGQSPDSPLHERKSPDIDR